MYLQWQVRIELKADRRRTWECGFSGKADWIINLENADLILPGPWVLWPGQASVGGKAIH